ncbi:XdhC/CoxI family protein [Conexibacter sp. DBS9H8]|uniref:XdhC family protein n=1 Tax=Conexibacter sp. DBS9H8 TaxID=2937801 RepID=UPI00200FA319|nr:XdhC/CoxI family protein [Conexibacter sp. DBS9H8]
MKEILVELDRLACNGERCAIATVLTVRRSAPRPPGAKLVVSETGAIAGSVSGGCVEGAVTEIAEQILAGAAPRLVSFGIADADGWAVGLPCGGEIDVWVEAYQPGPFESLARDGQPAVEVTVIDGPGLGAKLLVGADGVVGGSLGTPERDAAAATVAGELLWGGVSERRGELFFDVVGPGPRLFLFGAGDITEAVCRLARRVGLRPSVVDPRTRFADPGRFPDADAVIPAWPEEAIERLGGIDPSTSVVVLTHDPKLDDAALLIALRSPARFVGAMGSRTATVARRERLRAAGLTEPEVDRLVAPLGLDLGAVEREETALSIVAQIVAARHGRNGGPLTNITGPIH